MDGGAAGASTELELMSGGEAGTSGGPLLQWRRPRLLTVAAFVTLGIVYMVVNATSMIDERRALGQPIATWQPWALEATSFFAWLLLVPGILWLADRIALAGRPLLQIIAHVAITVPISLAHSGAMLVMRGVTYRMVNEQYNWSGPGISTLIYEYRKDAITYASILLIFLLLRRLGAPIAENPRTHEMPLIEIRDGNQTSWIRPDEIDWIEAAGNYVELHGSFGTKLARRTLTDIETELIPLGFVRVHRSRLVRKAAISTMEVRQSGDFEMALRCGTTIVGSRRYRVKL